MAGTLHSFLNKCLVLQNRYLVLIVLQINLKFYEDFIVKIFYQKINVLVILFL